MAIKDRFKKLADAPEMLRDSAVQIGGLLTACIALLVTALGLLVIVLGRLP